MLTCANDTGSGGSTHTYFRAPASADDLVATLGANADFYAPYQDNAQRWYQEAEERVPYLNHALIHLPIDCHRLPDDVADVYMQVERESDAGLIVSGALITTL